MAFTGAEKPEKYTPVPGEHELFESEQGKGSVELHLKEIAGEHICYLAHTLTLPDADEHSANFRNFICTIASDDSMAAPYMLTPKDREGMNNYLIMVKDLVHAFKAVGEDNVCVVFPGSGPLQQSEPSYLALTYYPPRKRRERGKAILTRCTNVDGVISVSYENRGKGSSSWRFDLGEFYLDDLRAAAELLEGIPGVEQEFEETQTRRREALDGVLAKNMVLDISRLRSEFPLGVGARIELWAILQTGS